MKWFLFGVVGILVAFCLFGCGGGEDEAPWVVKEQQEAPKYHVPVTPDPCTTTYPCEKK